MNNFHSINSLDNDINNLRQKNNQTLNECNYLKRKLFHLQQEVNKKEQEAKVESEKEIKKLSFVLDQTIHETKCSEQLVQEMKSRCSNYRKRIQIDQQQFKENQENSNANIKSNFNLMDNSNSDFFTKKNFNKSHNQTKRYLGQNRGSGFEILNKTTNRSIDHESKRTGQKFNTLTHKQKLYQRSNQKKRNLTNNNRPLRFNNKLRLYSQPQFPLPKQPQPNSAKKSTPPASLSTSTQLQKKPNIQKKPFFILLTPNQNSNNSENNNRSNNKNSSVNNNIFLRQYLKKSFLELFQLISKLPNTDKLGSQLLDLLSQTNIESSDGYLNLLANFLIFPNPKIQQTTANILSKIYCISSNYIDFCFSKLENLNDLNFSTDLNSDKFPKSGNNYRKNGNLEILNGNNESGNENSGFTIIDLSIFQLKKYVNQKEKKNVVIAILELLIILSKYSKLSQLEYFSPFITEGIFVKLLKFPKVRVKIQTLKLLRIIIRQSTNWEKFCSNSNNISHMENINKFLNEKDLKKEVRKKIDIKKEGSKRGIKNENENENKNKNAKENENEKEKEKEKETMNLNQNFNPVFSLAIITSFLGENGNDKKSKKDKKCKKSSETLIKKNLSNSQFGQKNQRKKLQKKKKLLFILKSECIALCLEIITRYPKSLAFFLKTNLLVNLVLVFENTILLLKKKDLLSTTTTSNCFSRIIELLSCFLINNSIIFFENIGIAKQSLIRLSFKVLEKLKSEKNDLLSREMKQTIHQLQIVHQLIQSEKKDFENTPSSQLSDPDIWN
ncbi:hypothetical protein M0812_27177 [Anaeramoeba flamelloides]|uniref:Uncharacterized protein n=1 Tax=Anaeramoeba flamelloides TaxID=1746091 RepID=A0AAV7Y4H1_9EUKA|nr:hypothetical protein M0812_27177 [Anaeramoeba flamelloides]